MYGVNFENNPDQRNILLYKGFVGYPLRKDFDIAKECPLDLQASPIESSVTLADDEQKMVLNFGPSHPATHGTIHLVLKLEGERIERADVHCGYLHRGFEKECERHNWQNIIPFTDRLNYCSPLINNFAYAEAVEALAGITINERCRYARTLLSECARLCDHLTCIAASLMELGAMTPFLYLMTIRDYFYEHLASLTGARLTHSFVRFGGLKSELSNEWLAKLQEWLCFYEEYIKRVHALVDRNRIFIDRMRNTGVISTADALSLGFTGPLLRSTGFAYDLRKAAPYLAYGELDFEIPVGISGDNYDRYYVRMREMDESVSMIRQCMKKMQAMAVQGLNSVNSDKTYFLPKIPVVSAGEIYKAHEGANGELGFYIVSVGGKIPYKLHVRAPSFVHMGGFHKMIEGDQLADIIATFGTINMIGGECDR
ncbi:MAG: NADH-quinone oxidoreductase subunit D [Oligoflexia bacterium]|nr:NADH-quinone oxidoreductase subunit D [Oligoflexia bacterium]